MNKQRLIPLIVATALFMENMDSTVIATSLPAIAADIGTSPLTLKLAITSYLLSLAVFIPASGWTADRFGARMVFSIAIGVFMIGSIGCALSQNVTLLDRTGQFTTVFLGPDREPAVSRIPACTNHQEVTFASPAVMF